MGEESTLSLTASYLTIPNCLVMVSISQQDIEQGPLQARLGFSLEEHIVGKGPGHVWKNTQQEYYFEVTLVPTYVTSYHFYEGEGKVHCVCLCVWAGSAPCTCLNGVLQLGVVLRGQQGVVVTRVSLQLFLGSTSCHPDSSAVLIGHTFTHKPLHFQNRTMRELHHITTEHYKA